MSDFLYTDYTGFYSQPTDQVEEKRIKETGSKRMKIIKILIGVLFLVIVAEIAIYIIVVPCSHPANVVFTGIDASSAEIFKNQLQQKCGNTWLNFKVGVASALIVNNPSVVDATVTKKFPDKIFINVTPRVPIAVTFTEINRRTLPIQIDKKGVLFKTNSAVSSYSVPLLTGLPQEMLKEGTRLSSVYISLLEEIAEIQNNNAEYFSAISEIHICPKEYDDFELEIYPINSKIKVRMDRNISSESLQYMMVVLDVLNTMEPNINEVDLRYGSVSYTTKDIVTGGDSVE